MLNPSNVIMWIQLKRVDLTVLSAGLLLALSHLKWAKTRSKLATNYQIIVSFFLHVRPLVPFYMLLTSLLSSTDLN